MNHMEGMKATGGRGSQEIAKDIMDMCVYGRVCALRLLMNMNRTSVQ